MSITTPRKPRIGLLALYLKLYDRVRPEWRDVLVPFAGQVAGEFAVRGIEVARAAVRRVPTPLAALRARIARGEDVSGLVPRKVQEYVAERGLYR